jgi:hypothetical protein
MSFLKLIEEDHDILKIYQSSSIITNYWNNRLEYIFAPYPEQFRVLFGHWLHEEMLKKALGTPCLVTSIREPISRFKSQYKFDLKIANENDFDIRSRDEFLKLNSNVYAEYLLNTFPSIAIKYDSKLDACLAILKIFDVLYESVDFDKKAPILANKLGIDLKGMPKRVNISENETDIPFSDAEISQCNSIDLEIYRVFSEAKNENPASDNPLYSLVLRDEYNDFLGGSYSYEKVLQRLGKIMEIEYSRYGVFDGFKKRLNLINGFY